MLTDAQLSQIVRNASQARRARMLDPLNKAIADRAIEAPLRTAAFVAQLAHESAEFQFMEELWGPTAAQNRYEPPSDLATRLGNTDPGDGKRYKGRGPIQITGRANYARYGKLLDLDLVAHPELAASPEVGFAIAGMFWQRNGLNELADARDFKAITQRINGGQNGAASRELFYARALEVLGVARAAIAPVARAAVASGELALERGTEGMRTLAEQADESRAGASRAGRKRRTFDARADTMDFRDLMYTPTLIEVPTHIPLGEFLEHDVPILDQGHEGACTGFGLATVANYLLLKRRVLPDKVPVSPRMLYWMALRYDEWPGEEEDLGSSARGAMKGWHKHGVCSSDDWQHGPGRSARDGLTEARTSSARKRPLGAYFRVNHKDLVAMHSAIAEVGILYATSAVHEGWHEVGADGIIEQSSSLIGGHAFAIVAYDDQGFWLQNSWGPLWGRGGFARVSYDDWLQNGSDVWVARLGAPVTLHKLESMATANASTSAQSVAYSYADLRPHIVSVGNNGELKAGGDYGSTPAELDHIFSDDIPRVVSAWSKPRILLYAHGGLVSEQAAVQRLAEYRPSLLGGEIYPLAFVWRSDYWTTITNLLQDAIRRRRPEGVLDAAKDFMLDRLDDALEPVARILTGKAEWDEMKENAIAASADGGAGSMVAEQLESLKARLPELEIHMVAHSAGAILLAPLLGLLNARGLAVETCTLWAPACTFELFDASYAPALTSERLKKLAIFALDEQTERDDNCARIYHKSLLYLVSNAFEGKGRVPGFRPGVPILGMQEWLKDGARRKRLDDLGVEVVIAPNDDPIDAPTASGAKHHGDFDDDEKTVHATFRRILAGALAKAGARTRSSAESGAERSQAREPGAVTAADFSFRRSESSLREQRLRIDSATQIGR